jgi:hypothetical protein
VKGEQVSDRKPRSCNFGVWWDCDLLRELLDGNRISKWNWQESSETRLVTAESCESKTWDTTSRLRPAFTWVTACRSSPGPRS